MGGTGAVAPEKYEKRRKRKKSRKTKQIAIERT